MSLVYGASECVTPPAWSSLKMRSSFRWQESFSIAGYAVKYLYKYITKGTDRIIYTIGDGQAGNTKYMMRLTITSMQDTTLPVRLSGKSMASQFMIIDNSMLPE